VTISFSNNILHHRVSSFFSAHFNLPSLMSPKAWCKHSLPFTITDTCTPISSTGAHVFQVTYLLFYISNWPWSSFVADVIIVAGQLKYNYISSSPHCMSNLTSVILFIYLFIAEFLWSSFNHEWILHMHWIALTFNNHSTKLTKITKISYC
jgi:hypothetical protein